jgi:hypothetical protein
LSEQQQHLIVDTPSVEVSVFNSQRTLFSQQEVTWEAEEKDIEFDKRLFDLDLNE